MKEKDKNKDHSPIIVEALEKDIPEQKPPNDKVVSFNLIKDESEL